MPTEIEQPASSSDTSAIIPGTRSSGTQSSVPTIPTTTDYTQKEVERLHNWMIAVVIGVVVAFLLGYSTFLYDSIKEKELYLEYSRLYTDYLEKNAELERKIMNEQLEINNLRNEINILRAKNPSLK